MMNTIVVATALVLFCGVAVSQEKASEKPKELPRPETQQEGDSPLVKAAKAAQAAKGVKAPSRLVINNEDVKKSKGKLIFITEKPLPKIETPAADKFKVQQEAKTSPPPGPEDVAKRVDTARKAISDLEKELGRLEEDYYNEDDSNYRDEEIEPRFEQAKRQLEKARQDLINAREEQQKLEGQAATRNSDPQ
jgi:hypothetical protein